jgi:hypothetical protein
MMAGKSETELNKELIEKLAEAAHEVFCEDLRMKGYRYGTVTDKEKKVHSALLPYAKLPSNEKEQNRRTVRDIPYKLAYAGYTIAPAAGAVAGVVFSDAEIEKLAEIEHERWMKEKLNQGWRYAKATDKKRKLHKDLVTWRDLSFDEREKDIVLVSAIPGILEKAGYIMVKVDSGSAGGKEHGA